MVRPEGVTIPSFGPDGIIPSGCIAITPRHSSVRVELPHPQLIAGKKTTHVNFRRVGFPLTNAYAVTDYWAEGATMPENQAWLLHLALPTDGHLQRSSFLVTLSRFRSADDVHLLCPMWASLEERRHVNERLHRALQMDADLAAELDRLRDILPLCV